MSLRDVFDTASEAADTRDNEFFAERVLPLVRKMLDRINEDPALGATAKLGGTDGGFYERPGGSRYNWAIEFDFHTKPDMAHAGKATLRLAGNVPEFAVVSPGDHRDLGSEREMNGVIESLVKQAGLNAGNRKGFSAANDALATPRQNPADAYIWRGGRTIV